VARREAIPILALGQPMAGYAERNHVFLHGFANAVPWGGHWNEKGHRLAGQMIADSICADWGQRAAVSVLPAGLDRSNES
jgi:hypothetical protein